MEMIIDMVLDCCSSAYHKNKGNRAARTSLLRQLVSSNILDYIGVRSW